MLTGVPSTHPVGLDLPSSLLPSIVSCTYFLAEIYCDKVTVVAAVGRDTAALSGAHGNANKWTDDVGTYEVSILYTSFRIQYYSRTRGGEAPTACCINRARCSK